MTSSLKLDVVRIDGGTQSRAALNEVVVDDYAQIVRDGTDFPPVVVFHDGKKYWLADGFHRIEAYRAAGAVEIAADIRQGDRRDAILYSVGANADHGLRRTNDDKRRAVMTLLNDAEWSKWSDREIAKQCGVSREYVNRLRPSVTSDPITSEARTYTTKHGTTATMDTAKIGKSKVAPEQQAEFDRQREESASQLSPEVQASIARQSEYSAKAKAAKSTPTDDDVEALNAEIEEQREHIAALEAELAEANAKLTKYDDMVVQYEKGGFEAVISGKDEQIRVLETRLYSTNRDMISWKNKAGWEAKEKLRYKAEAEKRGYSDDVDMDSIDPETGEIIDA